MHFLQLWLECLSYFEYVCTYVCIFFINTLHNTHYTLHTTQYKLHTTHYTLHTTHYTLHNTHYTLNITHYTLHILSYQQHHHITKKLVTFLNVFFSSLLVTRISRKCCHVTSCHIWYMSCHVLYISLYGNYFFYLSWESVSIVFLFVFFPNKKVSHNICLFRTNVFVSLLYVSVVSWYFQEMFTFSPVLKLYIVLYAGG